MGKRNSCTVLIIVICLIFFDKTAFAETYHYDKLNRVSEIIYDDGSSICYTYDSNGNITDIEKKAASGRQIAASNAAYEITGTGKENTVKVRHQKL